MRWSNRSHKNFGTMDPKRTCQAARKRLFPDQGRLRRRTSVAPQSQGWAQVQNRVSEVSSYFRLTSIVTIGSAEFTLYSLLERDQQGQTHVLMRSYSPD